MSGIIGGGIFIYDFKLVILILHKCLNASLFILFIDNAFERNNLSYFNVHKSLYNDLKIMCRFVKNLLVLHYLLQ